MLDKFDGQNYHHFCPSVPFFQTANGLRGLAQLVAPVNDWCHFSGLHEVVQDGQVLFVQFKL